MKKQKLQKQPEFLAEINFWMTHTKNNEKQAISRSKAMMRFKMLEKREVRKVAIDRRIFDES